MKVGSFLHDHGQPSVSATLHKGASTTGQSLCVCVMGWHHAAVDLLGHDVDKALPPEAAQPPIDAWLQCMLVLLFSRWCRVLLSWASDDISPELLLTGRVAHMPTFIVRGTSY